MHAKHTSSLPAPRGGASKHSKVASTLLEQIRKGRYKPGQLLPSEPELSRRFGVSRHTVRVALRSLYERGLILSQQGRGSVVQATAVEARYTFACDSVADLLQYAAATRRRLLGRARIRVDGALAHWLECESGQTWWEVRTCREREGGGATVASSRIYVPDAYAASVHDMADSQLPLFALMEARYGHRIARVRQTFSVALADTDEARDLGLESGAAVMCVERRFFDQRGGLLEVMRSVHPPAAFHYEMTVQQVIGQGSGRSQS